MTSVQVAFVLIFAVVQLSTAEYVVYGQKMTLDDNLSLNSNRCPKKNMGKGIIFSQSLIA